MDINWSVSAPPHLARDSIPNITRRVQCSKNADMDEKTAIGKTESGAVTHVEDQQQLNIAQQHGNAKIAHAQVQSVALADALAKDNPSPWSASMWKLYFIMFIVTLSKLPPGP